MTHRSKRVAKHSARVAKKASKKSLHYGRKAAVATGVSTVFVTKKLHHHLARRPHQHLMLRWEWYGRWHGWDYHRHLHAITLGTYIFLVFAIVLSSYSRAFASDMNTTWDFTDPGDYTYDTDTVETSGSLARLKAQNYATDGSTSALYHLDESSGSPVDDASSNANDATTTNSPAWVTGNLNNGLDLDGTNQYASAPDSASLSPTGQHSIEAWTKFDSTFSTSANQDQGIVDKGAYKLYYDRTSGKVNYEIANNNASDWTREAGNDANNSWDLDGKVIVRTSVSSGSDTYVGLGAGVGDAEVWHWNGTTWTQIGGDGKNSGWADQTYEDAFSLALNGTTLYAGIGTTAGDAEVWSCDTSVGCTDWTKIGGDAINSSWAISTYEVVSALYVQGGNLYAGLSNSAQDGEVWRWNGSVWTKIGGDGVSSSWAAATNIESVRTLTGDGTNIYAGLGDSANDAEVWRYNGTTWTQIGGDSLNSGWTTNIEAVYTLTYFGGNLYAGTGTTAGV